jgi:Ca2+-binding RTX toxin-like protein
MNFGDQDFGGADGGAFVLHSNSWGALGGAGGNLGAIGLPNALVIEFDTWQNDSSEPAADHTVIYSPGRPAFGTGQNGIVSLGNIEDGQWHRIEIAWNAATQTITTWFDGIQRDTKTADIITQIFANSSHVNFMITAATGGTTTTHQVRAIRADVLYEDVSGAQAPVLYGGPTRSLSVAENTTAAFHIPFATDAEGEPLTWSISGGADAARFAIDAATGALRFANGPDFESPADANGDNVYEVTIHVADPGGLGASQALLVTVTDIALEDLIGTSGADLLLGRPGSSDVIYGLGGADTVRAGEGADTIFATINDGDDFYHGGAGGNDLYDISATSADAVINLALATSAEIGADTLRSIEHINGGQGNDVITGNAGQNRLSGLGGNDTLRGNDGDDELFGGAGDDSLNGGNGADEMRGGIGNDIYVVNEADDYVFEAANEGADTVISSVSWTLGAHFEALQLTGTANLQGSGNTADNRILGNSGNNLLRGFAGSDTISAGQGADTLVGGLGADSLAGGSGADVFLYNNANEGGDTIIGYTAADDTIMVSAAGFGGGLVAGMDLVATGRYVANLTGETTAPSGIGQFIYETDTRILRWDPDGIGGAAAVEIVQLQSNSGWSGSEIVVIA